MPNNKKFNYVVSVFVLLSGQSLFAQNLNCTSKIGGSWNFGTAPAACNVSPLMTQDSVEAQYSPLLFNEASDVTTERKDFLSEMFSLLRDVGTSYLLRANPQASNEELNGFLEGLYTLAHQETFWTHYRLGKDQMIRYMRGDSDHGHGMMQVDDRSHVAALRNGRGVDLVYNIMYGLDVYYAAWVRAASASCVGSSTNYKNRARAAWSAYNRGPSKLCRWSSSSTTGDKGYLQKFGQRAWLKYVKDTAATVNVNVSCLMYNTRPCSLTGTPLPLPAPPPPRQHELIGKVVHITAPNGINLRDIQTNNILILIPRGTRLNVEDATQKDSDVKTYLKVSYSGRTGTIYAGHEKPTNTRSSWVSVESSLASVSLAQLTNVRSYQLLRECADISCAKSQVAVKGGSAPDSLQVLQKENNGWVKVKVAGTEESGWIESTDLVEIRE